jgi:hypothetical protein
MGNRVKRTIYLPDDLAREAEALAHADGRTLCEVIEDALRSSRIQRRTRNMREIQGYWSRVAREHGILTNRDLVRYLNT